MKGVRARQVHDVVPLLELCGHWAGRVNSKPSPVSKMGGTLFVHEGGQSQADDVVALPEPSVIMVGRVGGGTGGPHNVGHLSYTFTEWAQLHHKECAQRPPNHTPTPTWTCSGKASQTQK